MAGRNTKLTPELQERLCSAISAGNYYEAACSYAGIDYTTFWGWMKRGEKAGKGVFFDFFKAIQKAQADSEVSIVANWKKQIPEDWKAARDFLARRFPERWGPKETLTILQKAAERIQGMSDAEITELLAGRGGDLPGDSPEAGADRGAAPGANGAGPNGALPH